METTTPAGWYTDPHMAGTVRYWDGARWTEHTAPAPAPSPASTPVSDLGPRDSMHWIAPVGRSWQSITAGYLAFASILFATFGPFGIVVGGVTVWIAIWALRLAREGGHGRGRAIFGLVGGAIGILGGIAGTLLWVAFA